MIQLTSRRIRAVAETAKFDSPVGQNTNTGLRMWNGSPTRFDWRLDYAGAVITDLSNLVSLTMQIKASTDGAAPSEGAEALVSKTVTEFDDSLDAATWADASKQHAVFELTGAEANVGTGYKWLVLVASLTGIADPVTVAAGQLVSVSDGYDSGAGARPDPAASYLNTEQSNALYARAITQAIPNGQNYVDVDISSLALASAPEHCVASVKLPSAGADLVAVAGYHVTAANTVRVYLQAATPAADYSLSLLIIE